MPGQGSLPGCTQTSVDLCNLDGALQHLMVAGSRARWHYLLPVRKHLILVHEVTTLNITAMGASVILTKAPIKIPNNTKRVGTP